jgi:hypothetical protein
MISVLIVFGFIGDIVSKGSTGLHIGGWYVSYALIPELLLVPIFFLLGFAVKIYSNMAMWLCFAMAFLVIPIMVWEVSIHFSIYG